MWKCNTVYVKFNFPNARIVHSSIYRLIDWLIKLIEFFIPYFSLHIICTVLTEERVKGHHYFGFYKIDKSFLIIPCSSSLSAVSKLGCQTGFKR